MTDRLYSRISEIVERSDSDLPDTISITEEELEEYWDLWTNWVATERKFLPSVLVEEPERPLSVILELDGIYEKIVEQIRSQKQDTENNNGQ